MKHLRGGSNKWFSPDYGSPGKSYKRTGACLNKETLQSIIDNTELSEEEKSDAAAQIVELKQNNQRSCER